jgi:ribosome-associated heat shock protein Hsp15
MEISEIRIDKFLWAVRIFKTRTIATEECDKGRIRINNVAVKPSRKVKVGETVMVKKSPITYSFTINKLIDKRVPASLVPDCITDITPKEELEKRDKARMVLNITRDRGTGRPTKKERRELDHIFDIYDDEEDL